MILCSGIRRILTLFWSVCLVRVGRLGKTVPSVSSWFALFALLFVQNLTQFDIHFPDNVGRLGNKNTLIAKLQFYLISSLCLCTKLKIKRNVYPAFLFYVHYLIVFSGFESVTLCVSRIEISVQMHHSYTFHSWQARQILI